MYMGIHSNNNYYYNYNSNNYYFGLKCYIISRDNGSSVRAPHSAYENLDTRYANLINTKPIRSAAPLILVFFAL